VITDAARRREGNFDILVSIGLVLPLRRMSQGNVREGEACC